MRTVARRCSMICFANTATPRSEKVKRSSAANMAIGVCLPLSAASGPIQSLRVTWKSFEIACRRRSHPQALCAI